jgi:hypothetical protein
MTVDEIKRTVTMPEVVRRYGIEIHRGGMCSCPFHGSDRHPSMQIFKDGFKCYACGESGDIFAFVQKMDNCDFKTAFLSLGGTYEHEDKTSRIRLYRIQKAKETKKNKTRMLKKKRDEALKEFFTCQELLRIPKKEITPLLAGIINRYWESLWKVEAIEQEMGILPKKTEKERALELFRISESRPPEFYRHYKAISLRWTVCRNCSCQCDDFREWEAEHNAMEMIDVSTKRV